MYGVPPALSFFFKKLTDGIICQHSFCQQPLQFRVLDFQGFQPLGIVHLQTTVLALPAVVRGRTDLFFPAEIFHRLAFSQFFIGFAQEFHNLFGLSSSHLSFAPF